MLTREEIIKRIDQDELVISPLLDRELQVHSGRIDFRLGMMFMVPQHNRSAYIDPVQQTRSDSPLERFQMSYYVPLGKAFVIHPNETVLGASLEYICLPANVAGMIAVRSSWSRLGLAIAPGLIVTPGNKSSLTLEISNQGRIPIEVYPGARIGHLILIELSKIEDVPSPSRYSYAVGPQYSKLDQDPEMSFLGEYPIIIGVTGLLNAGKSEVANYLATRLGFFLRSTSTILKEEISYLSMPNPTSDQKYSKKLEIRKEKGDNVLVVKAVQAALRDNPKGLVLDGLDHESEIMFLRKVPNFHLIAVTGDTDLRYRRYLASARTGEAQEVTFEEFNQLDQRQRKSLDTLGNPSAHADQIDRCIELADYVIDRGLDAKKNDALIDKWITLHGFLNT